MSETASSIPNFQSGDVTFQCMVKRYDDGTSRYLWRSECGRFAVWREGAKCIAERDGQVIGRDYPTLGKAMIASQHLGWMEHAA